MFNQYRRRTLLERLFLEGKRSGRATITLALIAIITTLGLAAFVAANFSMVGAVIVIGVAALIFVLSDSENMRRRALAAQRRDETFAGFARSFGDRDVNHHVSRVIYDELRDDLGFPVRCDDEIVAELGFGNDRLWDFLAEVAARCEKDLSDYLDAPVFDHIGTVEDLVIFVSDLPDAPDR